ncbi:MAG TPA: HAD family hydrolase [Polyangiaceae bacterium]
MHADALIFDLDGTLWDTCDTCAAAWNRVTRALGLAVREVTADDVRGVAGLPHTEGVRRVFDDLSEADVELVSERTQREDNRALAETGGTLYPGVSELVPRLGAALPLFIVSNCQAGYIEVFLETSGLTRYFADFECWGRTGRTKSENLRSLVDRNRLWTPWFVGDTEGDRNAARENGVRFAHAAYGFGKVSDSDARLETFEDTARLVGT